MYFVLKYKKQIQKHYYFELTSKIYYLSFKISFWMKSSRRKSIHKSQWKTITVIENNEKITYDLNKEGKLLKGFKKQKYRSIVTCYEKLIYNAIKKQQNESQTKCDKKKQITADAISNILFDKNEDEMDLFDELEGLNYFDLSK